MDKHPLYDLEVWKMKVNKENMIKAINTMIKMEGDNKFNAPMNDEHDIMVWKDGYRQALNNLLFAISVNGE